jgi:hypothetical protein
LWLCSALFKKTRSDVKSNHICNTCFIMQGATNENGLMALAAIYSPDQSQYRARCGVAALEKDGRRSDQNINVSAAG